MSKISDHFCILVEQVVQDYCPGEIWLGPKVVLVAGNYVIHRSKKANRVLERYADRLLVVALPTDSPKLNLIELLWKHLRRQVTHDHLFDSDGNIRSGHGPEVSFASAGFVWPTTGGGRPEPAS